MKTGDDDRIGNSDHPPQQEGGLLITGCPRSATRSVHEWFEAHGVHLGHETAGDMGTIEWRHAYTEEPDFILRLTLVRDPVKTVMSLCELLTNCNRENNFTTWEDICKLSVQGGWNEKLSGTHYFDAATDWWTTVYKRLHQYPVIKAEHIPKLPHKNHNKRVDRDFDAMGALKDKEDFWRVARMYGYYLEESDV